MLKIIVNPQADKGKSLVCWKDIESVIKRLKIPYNAVLTEGQKHATHLAWEAQQAGAKIIFVVGGDGTVSEVINGIHFTDIVLGIIPTGSGNDFAKMIGVRTISDGLNLLNSAYKREVDIGHLNKNQYFINNLGIGLDAFVVAKQRETKVKHEISYLFSTLKILSRFSAFPIEVKSPDFTFSGNALSVSIGNGQFHGGLFRLTPQAEIDDGFLDVCIIKEAGKLRRFLDIPKAVCGTHLSLKEVENFRAKNIFISSPLPFPFHLDGELFAPVRQLHVDVLPKKIRFLGTVHTDS